VKMIFGDAELLVVGIVVFLLVLIGVFLLVDWLRSRSKPVRGLVARVAVAEHTQAKRVANKPKRKHAVSKARKHAASRKARLKELVQNFEIRR